MGLDDSSKIPQMQKNTESYFFYLLIFVYFAMHYESKYPHIEQTNSLCFVFRTSRCEVHSVKSGYCNPVWKNFRKRRKKVC